MNQNLKKKIKPQLICGPEGIVNLQFTNKYKICADKQNIKMVEKK